MVTGRVPRIIVYWKNAAGNEEVRQFIDALSPPATRKCDQYIEVLRTLPFVPSMYMKHIEDDLYELRPELGGNEYRLLFGMRRNIVVFVHAFMKKRSKLDPTDSITARKRFDEWKGANL